MELRGYSFTANNQGEQSLNFILETPATRKPKKVNVLLLAK